MISVLALAANAQVKKPQEFKAGDVRKNLAGIEFVWIPPGEFIMGSTEQEAAAAFAKCKAWGGEKCRQDWFTAETPKHKVQISHGFWIGKYEVTQEQWMAVTGSNPSGFKDCGATCPVENVLWSDVQAFIKNLNAKKDGSTYGLPTEAEWEYACRAGTTTDYYGELDSIAWYGENAEGKTHPVGQKKPNAFGLYDMSGNVGEWCQDLYGWYPTEAVTDPAGASTGKSRVYRGGGYFNAAEFTRSAYRGALRPTRRHDYVGFRLIMRSVTPRPKKS